MAKYRYIKNVKPSWDQTTSFKSVDPEGNEVVAVLGEIVDLDPKAARDLSEYFVLEKVKDEAAPVVVNPKKAPKKAVFNKSLEGGE